MNEIALGGVHAWVWISLLIKLILFEAEVWEGQMLGQALHLSSATPAPIRTSVRLPF